MHRVGAVLNSVLVHADVVNFANYVMPFPNYYVLVRLTPLY